MRLLVDVTPRLASNLQPLAAQVESGGAGSNILTILNDTENNSSIARNTLLGFKFP